MSWKFWAVESSAEREVGRASGGFSTPIDCVFLTLSCLNAKSPNGGTGNDDSNMKKDNVLRKKNGFTRKDLRRIVFDDGLHGRRNAEAMHSLNDECLSP